MGLMGDIAEKGSDLIQDHEKRIKQLERIGELIHRNSKNNKLEQVAKVGRKLVDLSKKAKSFFESSFGKRLVKTAKSPILNAGQHVITGMKLTTGVGDPESGDRFDEGAGQMGAAGRTLQTAYPDNSWDSGGADAYFQRNDDQVGRTERVIDADGVVVRVLAREAEQIATVRDNLDAQSDWLADMSLITMAVGFIPCVGQAAKTASEIAMVAKAVEASTNELVTMQHNASANAAELQSAVQMYSEVAQGATHTGSVEDPGTKPERIDETVDRAEDADDRCTPGEESPDASRPPIIDPPRSAPSGGGAPVGGGGSASGGGTPGGAPTAVAPLPADIPSSGAFPSSGQPSVASSAGELTGTLLGSMGSILGPLMSALSGAGQTASGAAQTATEAASSAVDAAAQAKDPATFDADVETPEGDDEDGKDEEKDRDEDRDDDEGGEAEGNEDGDGAGAGPGGAEKPQHTEGMDLAGPSDPGAAKTLPPDLSAGTGTSGGNAIPVHSGGVFDRNQPEVPVAAKLDGGNPGSATVTKT